jgi:hypothetical protein
MEISCQLHALAALARGKSSQFPLDRKLSWPLSRSGRCEVIFVYVGTIRELRKLRNVFMLVHSSVPCPPSGQRKVKTHFFLVYLINYASDFETCEGNGNLTTRLFENRR